jgi:predicted small integral membrane protein
MPLRIIKILLSLFLALLALFYATQNMVNLEQAFGAVAYVLGNVDHAVYPESFGPAITAKPLLWAALFTIILMEYLTGLVLLKGTLDLWLARSGDSAAFRSAKRWTLVGAGLGMLVWFGLFHVLGGALFQQWQTQAGDGSLRGAFWYGAMMALVALYIAQTPDD